MEKRSLSFLDVTVKTILTHTVTYFLVGWLAYSFFSHVSLPGGGSIYTAIRPVTDPLVMLGTPLQAVRGLLFGLVFYLLQRSLFSGKNGGLLIWLTLLVFGILGTFGPTAGSLEGMIFTYQPLLGHLYSLPEIVLQSLLLSLVLFYWVNHPEKKWLNWAMGTVYVLVITMALLGIMVNTSL